MVGLLLVHLYGTRAAADDWHCEYSGLLEELGFVKGDASARTFRHALRGIVCSVHGDDFTSSGPKASLDWMKTSMEEKYELTSQHALAHPQKTTRRFASSIVLSGGLARESNTMQIYDTWSRP